MPELDETLVEQATELELNLDDFDTNDELKAAIDEKLKNESDDNNDPDALKERIEFQKREAKKAFEARDRIKKDRAMLKSKLSEMERKAQELESKLADSPDPEEYQSLKERIEAIEKEAEEKAMAKMDESEKLKVRFQKQLDEFDKKFNDTQKKYETKVETVTSQLEQTKREVQDLRRARLGGEIVRIAAKLNAYNPEQIERILVHEFQYDNELEDFTYIERDHKGKIVDEKSVEERVREFLEDPDNDNLVSSKAKGGVGSKEQGTDKKSSKAAEDRGSLSLGAKLKRPGQYDPKDPDLQLEADERGLEVEDYINILKIRDAKMNKIKGISEESG